MRAPQLHALALSAAAATVVGTAFLCLVLRPGAMDAAADEDDGFGDAILGVSLRAEEVPTPIGETSLMSTILLDVRTTDGEREISPPLLVGSDSDAPLSGLTLVPQIQRDCRPGGALPADKTTSLQLRYLRTAEDVPDRVAVRARTWVRDTDPAPQLAQSRVFEIPLASRPRARRMTADDLRADGNVPVFLVYHDHGGLDGHRALEVQPGATARALRTTVSTSDDDPEGIWSAQITSDEIVALGRALHAGRVWELADVPMRPLLPDESSVELYVVVGNAALVAEFPLASVAERESWPALRDHLATLRTRVIARARKGPR